MGNYYGLGNIAAPKKRRAFFSFHYDDIMRVNNVRNAWKIDHPDAPQNRSFQDSSLWEERQLTDPEKIKDLIRAGVDYTSAVCVLVGTKTWQRRWVKYEVARSVIDGKGLLAIHVNGLRHHSTGVACERGFNPLHLMGIQMQDDGKHYLIERVQRGDIWQWEWYQDYTHPVSRPSYMPAMPAKTYRRLADCTTEYDFAGQNGSKNIGGWIDLAAQEAGR